MKRLLNQYGTEEFSFGADNKLKIFPPNSFKFKPKDHIVVDDVQECILDNLWNQYNHKREDRGYMLSILHSLAEYFNMINENLPIKEDPEYVEARPLYIIFEGKPPGLYITFEEVMRQKIAAKPYGNVSWKKYGDIDIALEQARKILGVNYYIEPAAKSYIQNFKRSKNKKVAPILPFVKIKEEKEESSKKLTYKECLMKEVDPLDGTYIDWKIDEKLEEISPQWKEELKDEILNNIRKEIDDKFEELKKIYDEKFEIPLIDDDEMDVAGHGQNSN